MSDPGVMYRAVPLTVLQSLIALAEVGSRYRANIRVRVHSEYYLPDETIVHDIETLVAARQCLAGNVEDTPNERA